jgi:hypothetical protein
VVDLGKGTPLEFTPLLTLPLSRLSNLTLGTMLLSTGDADCFHLCHCFTPWNSLHQSWNSRYRNSVSYASCARLAS